VSIGRASEEATASLSLSTVRSICSSSRPLLTFGYINGYEDESYVTVTDAVHQWQRVPLKQLPPIGYFTDSSCVVGSGGRVHWFFGLQNNAPPAIPTRRSGWVGSGTLAATSASTGNRQRTTTGCQAGSELSLALIATTRT
jgi:hypothetical protein